MFYKKIIIIGFVSLAFLPSTSSPVSAQMEETDKSAFSQVVVIPANQFVVPTVVSVPFTDLFRQREDVYVEDKVTGIRQQTLWRIESVVVPTSFTVTGDSGLSLVALRDGREETTSLFPVNIAGGSEATLSLAFGRSLSVSALNLTLAKNVQLPETISITTRRSGGRVEVVVNQTRVTGLAIRFPEINTDNLLVTFTYSQPLSISELSVNEKDPLRINTESLRFLAQPSVSYQIFFDPDRPVPGPVGESANLRNDLGVVLIEPPAAMRNSLYVSSDRDGDEVMDQVDNCPNMANTDQVDIDGSGVGDACEDFDRDGVFNNNDNCINQPNGTQADEDGDGIGDACDDSESRLTEKYAWILWVGMGLAGLTLALLFMIVARRDPNLTEPL